MRRMFAAGALLLLLSSWSAGCSDDNGTESGSATTTTATGCDRAGGSESAETQTIEVDGHDREYVVHLPPDYGERPAPLILNLHGFGGTIDQQDDETQLPEQGGERGYIVVTPQGLPISIPAEAPQGAQAEGLEGLAFWNFFGSSGVDFGEGVTIPNIDPNELGVDDVKFFDTLLDTLEADYCVDAERIYVTGMSNGAGMATTLGCELGGRLDAIAPVSGVNLSGACPGDTPISVQAIHGDADDVATYRGGTLMGFPLGNPSVPARMVAWAEHNSCTPEPETAEDGSITILTWDDCADGTTVRLWTIHGWGHDWPRAASPDQPGAIDATTVVLDFFDDQGQE